MLSPSRFDRSVVDRFSSPNLLRVPVMLTNTNVNVMIAEANKAEANVCAAGMGWAGGAKVEATLK